MNMFQVSEMLNRAAIGCARTAELQPLIPVDIEALADPALIDRWYREKGMLACGLRASDLMAPAIDVLVKPVVGYAELRQHARWIKVGSLTVPIASINHRIAMKTGTGRNKDAINIDEFKKTQAGGAP